MSLLLFRAFLPSFAYLFRTPSAFLSNSVQFPSPHIPHLSVLTALAQLLHQLCLKRTARMGTALCSSPGAVFGRVLFGLRVSPSSTIGFRENLSVMFLGMVMG